MPRSVIGGAGGILRVPSKRSPRSSMVISAGSGANPLLTDLVAYWKLDEASGTRADSVGSNDLADNNTVTSATGKVGDAAEFFGPDNEYLSIADNTDLSMGDIDFTIAAWVVVDGGPFTQRCILGKWNVGNNREYLIIDDSGLIEFWVSSDGLDTIIADSAFTPTAGVFFLVVVWHDATANTINIQINNGTPVSTSHAGGVFDGNSEFRLGNAIQGAELPLSGLVDEVGVWKRVLTADERTEFYNSGNGITYPF